MQDDVRYGRDGHGLESTTTAAIGHTTHPSAAAATASAALCIASIRLHRSRGRWWRKRQQPCGRTVRGRGDGVESFEGIGVPVASGEQGGERASIFFVLHRNRVFLLTEHTSTFFSQKMPRFSS